MGPGSRPHTQGVDSVEGQITWGAGALYNTGCLAARAIWTGGRAQGWGLSWARFLEMRQGWEAKYRARIQQDQGMSSEVMGRAGPRIQ